MRPSVISLILFFAYIQSSGAFSGQQKYEPLILRNTFATASEALTHFLERDASGAFWAGILDSERRSLTTWTQPPDPETYLLYRERKIGEPQQSTPDEVAIAVSWSGVTHRDGHGTRMPASEDGKFTQIFRLKRVQGEWKITEPAARDFRSAIRANPK